MRAVPFACAYSARGSRESTASESIVGGLHAVPRSPRVEGIPLEPLGQGYGEDVLPLA